MRKFIAKRILLLCALASAICGCKTTEVVKEVPVMIEHTTTNNHTDIIRDTLMMRDSVFHFIQGDTVRIEHYKTLYQSKHDTLYIDSVVVREVPVEVVRTEVREVAKPPPWWKKALMWMGAALLCFIGFKAYRVVRSLMGK